MTKAKCSEQDKEFVSALVDNEEQLNAHSGSDINTDMVARYSLIGDVMRSETASHIQLDIASKVAQQLEQEPVHADFSGLNTQKSKGVSRLAPAWWRNASQMAIAAGVAVCAVVGVQQYSNVAGGDINDPMLQTQPLLGGATPTSYSSEPALQNAEQGLRELQEQRIGALVLEHQRQTREAARFAANDDTESAKEQ